MKAIIEMPRGTTRRIHWNKEKQDFVDLGSIRDVIPVNNGIMPVDYGFLEGTFCEGDQEEIDVLILTERKLKTGERLEVDPIAMLVRADGDHKIVAVDATAWSYIKFWEDAQESLRKMVLESFGYYSAIEKIAGRFESRKYIAANQAKENAA